MDEFSKVNILLLIVLELNGVLRRGYQHRLYLNHLLFSLSLGTIAVWLFSVWVFGCFVLQLLNQGELLIFFLAGGGTCRWGEFLALSEGRIDPVTFIWACGFQRGCGRHTFLLRDDRSSRGFGGCCMEGRQRRESVILGIGFLSDHLSITLDGESVMPVTHGQ